MEDIFDLIFIANFSFTKLEKHTAIWIICEAEKNIVKSRDFHNATFLDYHILRGSNKRNTSGRLDYQKMDDLFYLSHKQEELKKYLKKGKKYFYQNILSLDPSSRKEIYANHTLKYYPDIDSVTYKENDLQRTYNYICPFCTKKHKVYLKDNKDKKIKANVKEFITVSKNMIYFNCNHENTVNENEKFGVRSKEFSCEKDKQYQQAFLYLYFMFESKEKDMSFSHIDKDGNIQDWKIQKYLTLLKDA